VQLEAIPSAPASVEQWATSLLWPTAEELRAGLQQELEAGGSGGDGPAESPVFVRNVRGDADACDGLLRGRRSENALLTMIEVSVAEMLCPCSMMWLFKGAMSASPAACAATS